MRITAYAYNAALHCPRCALHYAARRGGRGVMGSDSLEGVTDSEGNAFHPVFETDENADGYCDTCRHAFGDADPVVQLLSVEAWRDGDGWTWNNCFSRGMVPASWCDLNPRALLRALRESGRFDTAPGRVAIEDDGYNLVIVARGTREPLGALAYGEAP
jgi:hypothetical protein